LVIYHLTFLIYHFGFGLWFWTWFQFGDHLFKVEDLELLLNDK